MKLNRLAIFLVIVFAGFSAKAQNTLKIGHVNIQELVQKHPAADSIQAVLEAETKEMEKLYGEMISEHETKLAAFEKEKSGYSEFVLKSKENELVEMAQKIQDYNRNAQQQLQKRNMELLKPVYEQINREVSNYAGLNHFTYILDISTGCAAYISPESENITPKILEKLKL